MAETLTLAAQGQPGSRKTVEEVPLTGLSFAADAIFPWYDTAQTFGSYHPGGCQMMYADGAVVFLTNELDINIHRSLGKLADGNPFGKAP